MNYTNEKMSNKESLVLNQISEFIEFKGIGFYISIIEKKILTNLKKLFMFLSKIIMINYNSILNSLLINILNSNKLTYYSRIIILSTICTIIIKYISKNLIKKKSKRLSLNQYLFFSNKSIKNALLEKGSKIKIENEEKVWEQISNFIEKTNNSKTKINKDNIHNPFYQIMKFYIDFSKKSTNLKVTNIK